MLSISLRQPLPDKKLFTMTDSNYQAAGYAVLTENGTNQKFTSTRKTYAPFAHGSKTVTPLLKKSNYAKQILAIYLPFKDFGLRFWGTPNPVIIMKDSKLLTQFFETKVIPPPLWNACHFVLQFNITKAHIPGKKNTATDFPSRLESHPKKLLEIREDVPA